MDSLSDCVTIELLSLEGNPFAQNSTLFRSGVVTCLPFLKELDGNVVTDDELYPQFARGTVRFHGMSKYSELDLPGVMCIKNNVCDCTIFKMDEGRLNLYSEVAVEAYNNNVPLS